jgi:hypothetical protein
MEPELFYAKKPGALLSVRFLGINSKRAKSLGCGWNFTPTAGRTRKH